jgi:hypothetical protein
MSKMKAQEKIDAAIVRMEQAAMELIAKAEAFRSGDSSWLSQCNRNALLIAARNYSHKVDAVRRKRS